MSSFGRITAVMTAVGVLAASPLVFAAQPGHADFDACNREAQAKLGASASPRTHSTAGGAVSGGTSGGGVSAGGSLSGGATGGSVSGGTSAGTAALPRTDTGASAGGAVSGGATGGGLSGGVSGSAGSTGGTLSGGTSTSAGSGGGTLSSGTSTSSDSLLQGMASTGSSDPGFQQAYRECMQRRGF